jgi:hypothetical protein
MKKLIVFLATGSLLISLFSFEPVTNDIPEIKVKVTAEKVTEFDMYQYSDTNSSKLQRHLKTPYEFTIKTNKSHFLFKSLSENSEIKVEAKCSEGGSVIGQWPVVVILTNNKELTTFGID